MSPTGARDLALAALLPVAVVGCGNDAGVEPAPPPEIIASAVTANPNNVLSAIVTVTLRFADSVGVRYGLAGTSLDSAASAVVALDPSTIVPVLGLLPNTRYTFAVVAYGETGTVTGPTLELQTGSLPADVPVYVASGSDPSPGYVAFAAREYGLVIDNGGRIVWYHRFPYGPGLNFMVQPTGRYVARPSTPDPTDMDLWMEIDPLGIVTRTFGCARDLEPRFHDLIGLEDHSYWVLCDETRTMDLSPHGGSAASRVVGTVIQHVGAGGNLVFEWSPFDHFAITDLPAATLDDELINWTHGNALDLDADGNLVVSFRNLSEITKIDVRTGVVLWRLGGLHNEFTIEGELTPPFARQHGARMTGAGELILLDNLGDPASSRAERYVLDEVRRTARLTGAYSSAPSISASLGGTTQALPGGRLLVAYGSGARVEEYDAGGHVVWRIEGDPGDVFRAQRISSLYHPRADPR